PVASDQLRLCPQFRPNPDEGTSVAVTAGVPSASRTPESPRAASDGFGPIALPSWATTCGGQSGHLGSAYVWRRARNPHQYPLPWSSYHQKPLPTGTQSLSSCRASKTSIDDAGPPPRMQRSTPATTSATDLHALLRS